MKEDLRSIWIEIEGQITPRPESELREILLYKSRQIVKRFRWVVGIGTAICSAVLVFLVIASFSLRQDVLYLINNSLLVILLVAALIQNIRFFKDLNRKTKGRGNVCDILKEKALKIDKVIQQEKQILLLPVISLLLLISINVYFSSGSFIRAFQDEENVWGLVFGFLAGFLVALYFTFKINRQHKKDLKVLRNYLHELETEG